MRCRQLIFVLTDRALVDGLVKDIYLGHRELPGAHFPLKQQIQLGKRTASRFWDSEVGVDNAEEAKSCPEERREVLSMILATRRRSETG